MAKIQHSTFRREKAIIGSYEVEFDDQGVATVEDETARSIRGIPGFEILSTEDSVQNDVAALEPDLDLPEDDSELIRTPIADEKPKRGRKKKADENDE